MMDNLKENVYQESAGPKIDFINVVWDWSTEVSLDQPF